MMKLEMEKKELTEDQIQLFLQYGSIPEGYSKEEIVELTKHSRPDSYEHIAEYQNTPLVGKDYYRFCEICSRPIWGSVRRLNRRRFLYYPGDNRRRYNAFRYCYICHKSMCNSCKKGVVCKNCQEFFPEKPKLKNKSLINLLLIIIFSSLALSGFALIALIAVVLIFPQADLRIPFTIIVFLIWFSFTSPFLTYYLITKNQLEFTRNFIEDLKENSNYDENLVKNVYSVYDDGHEHIENESRLTYIKNGLWLYIPFSILFIGMILSKIWAL
ncbi:hypothetical protein ES708_23203 [subsurface metagenome]